MFRKILLIICCTGLLMSCSKQKHEPTLDEMLGQMLITGFYGMEAPPESRIAEEIKKYHLGGVILFDYNPVEKNHNRNISSKAQVKKLNKQLQEAADIPLFIAVDQEGGKVARLKEEYGYKKPLAPKAVGALDFPDQSELWSTEIAGQLKSSGFNLNFAPVVDLEVNKDCPVIAGLQRSFSDDPEKVVANASIFIENHHKNNVLTAIKHFPGHGSSMKDSHEGFTDVSNTWSEKELIPFRELINSEKPDMIMTAHIYNSQIDSLYPATLSEKTINGLLREQLGWQGVVVSDGLLMKAITENYTRAETIEKAVNAGVDILLFASPKPDEEIAKEVFTTLKNLVETGKIPLSRIEESYKRIMTLKERL